MESFAKLMSTIGSSSGKKDLVATLPVEVVEIIFRQLDPRSLLNVARVSKKWMNVCRGDCKLRRTARHHLQKEQRQLFDVETKVSKLKINQKAIPARVNLKNTFVVPTSFSFRPSSGVMPGSLTGSKRNGNRISNMASKKAAIRLR